MIGLGTRRDNSLKEHPSLVVKKAKKPKPLITDEELSEIAKKALLTQVDKRIIEISRETTTMEQILQSLQQLQETFTKEMGKLTQNAAIERDVLLRLKEKLSES